MSAPATEQPPVEEQPTQPLPTWQRRTPEHSTIHCQQSGPGLWAVPVTILAAIGAGELIRGYVLLTDVARSNFAIIALTAVLVVSLGVFLCARRVGSEDTGADSVERES